MKIDTLATPKPEIKAILFDFDGTIIDTNEVIFEGLNRFAESFRGSALTDEEHQALAGKPLIDQMAYIHPERAEDMSDLFRVWYLDAHKALAKPFDGILDLFDFLKQCSYKLMIVSNNSRQTVRVGLNQLGLDSVFDDLICYEDVSERKPSPEGLLLALKKLGLEKDEVIFVGDSSNDLLAAKNANILSVLVGWTAISRDTLLSYEPDFVIEHPMEILQLIGIANSRIA